MFAFRIRGRRWWLAAIAIALVVSVAVPLLRSRLEQAVRARIETAAVRRGVIARIGVVHIGVRPLVRLDGVDLDLRYGLHAHADMIAATWPGHLQLAVRGAALVGPAGISVSAPATVWDATGTFDDDLRLALVAPQAGLSIHKLADPAGGGLNIELHGLDVGRLFDVRRDSHPLLDGGIEDGRVEFQFSSDVLRFHVDMGARGARVVALADHDDGEFQLGDPTDVTMRFDGTWRRAGAVVDIPEVHATWAGADLSGSIALRDLDTDPAGDLALGVQHLDFVQLLDASGLGVPESLGLAPGAGRDLGSVSIDLHIRGRLSDPASLSVTPKVDFKPPREIPAAILRLRGDFVFSSQQGSGPQRPIDVSPSSPDFIALHDVPPLFVRTLLLSEDAGFYGHHGIDLRELPIALLTDWARGGAARGASTITQQLAKNLFLSRDKQLGRKLQELAITFLLESVLGKNRILEIYLNIIEWGPDLRGLRPAARSYFGREPRELTPAEMAFLVAIIPGPIKYQASFAHGMPGPGLRSLIDDLLAKLRSVDAIGEEEYRQALDEPIVVVGGRPR